MDDHSYREIRNAAIFVVAMADFWKDDNPTEKQERLDSIICRQIFFAHLADQAAQDRVWKAGYNFFSGDFHGSTN